MNCSCGRMDCDPGEDLCRACEEDYHRRQMERAREDDEQRRLYEEKFERGEA